MTEQEIKTAMRNESKAIAKRINRVIPRWTNKDKASRFNSLLDIEIQDFNFENENARSFFRIAVNLEFAKLSNYRIVFPQVIYK